MTTTSSQTPETAGPPVEQPTGHDYRLSELQTLEAESIHIFREVAAEFGRPALMFSGGKDSLVMLHLAAKAFFPARIPFKILHIDTGHNFPEVMTLRDKLVEEMSLQLVVGSVQDAIDSGDLTEVPGQGRNRLQTHVLLETVEKNKFDVLMGGGRRDEEKARAKERVFSFRDEFGQWDPKNQRPELWNLYNGRIHPGESIRAFPISNWTELDVWSYIEAEKLQVPGIYFAHERKVFERDGMLLADSDVSARRDDEPVFTATVRYRTVGDMSCTGAVESDAHTLAEIIDEIAASRITERGATRADDRFSEAAMEDRKREGYF